MRIEYTKIFYWCCDTYGLSKYYDSYPEFFVDRRELSQWLGCYLEDCIIIYPKSLNHHYKKANKRLYETIKTIIHEYQHYLECPEVSDKYQEKYRFEKNPYEIKAEKIARRDYLKCYKNVYKKERKK